MYNSHSDIISTPQKVFRLILGLYSIPIYPAAAMPLLAVFECSGVHAAQLAQENLYKKCAEETNCSDARDQNCAV